MAAVGPRGHSVQQMTQEGARDSSSAQSSTSHVGRRALESLIELVPDLNDRVAKEVPSTFEMTLAKICKFIANIFTTPIPESFSDEMKADCKGGDWRIDGDTLIIAGQDAAPFASYNIETNKRIY